MYITPIDFILGWLTILAIGTIIITEYEKYISRIGKEINYWVKPIFFIIIFQINYWVIKILNELIVRAYIHYNKLFDGLYRWGLMILFLSFISLIYDLYLKRLQGVEFKNLIDIEISNKRLLGLTIKGLLLAIGILLLLF